MRYERANAFSRPRPTGAGKGSLLALPALIVLYGAMAVQWGVPTVFAVLYLAASIVCFIAYWVDKRAAQSGGWRIQESTLLLFGLAGGWPGAILAQVLLRHKSTKPSFRWRFWLTVVLNLAAFIFLCSPYVPPEVRGFLQRLSPAELPLIGQIP